MVWVWVWVATLVVMKARLVRALTLAQTLEQLA